MFNSNVQNKFLARMFRRINGLVWELNTGKTGIKTNDGIFTIEISKAEDASDNSGQVTVNPFDSFGMSLPAFATQVPHDKINVGDIIVGDKGILGWVINKKEVALQLMDTNGMTKNYTPPKVGVLGSEGALVVQNLMTLTGGKDGLGSLQGNLLPLLMVLGDNDSAMEKILPMMLFSQTTGAGAGKVDPMMMAMMMGGLGKGGSGIDPKMLLLSGAMGGGAGGMNPMLMMALMGDGGLDGLFGGKGEVIPETSNAINGVPALQPISKNAPRRY